MLGNPECSKTPLGKVSNAAVSLTKHRRKSEKERPLSSIVHHRATLAGHLVIIEGGPDGWTAITEQGVFTNPWTKKPFSSKKSAMHAAKRRLQKGRWPGKIGKNPAQKPYQ